MNRAVFATAKHEGVSLSGGVFSDCKLSLLTMCEITACVEYLHGVVSSLRGASAWSNEQPAWSSEMFCAA